MTREDREFPAGLDLPEADRVIAARGDGPMAIGQEGHLPRPGGVAPKAAELRSGLRLPEDRGRVVPAGEQPATVGRGGQAEDVRLVSLEARREFPAALHVPDPDGEFLPFLAG